MTFLARIPRLVVTMLLIIAIINLLVGVVLRYVFPPITDYMGWDSVPFTWVEEVGEMTLAWMTLIGAAIGIRARTHFTLHVFVHRLPGRVQRMLEIVHHVLIAGVGALTAWYAWGLCVLNWTLKTPGLEISLAVLYGSAFVGGILIALYALSMIVAPMPPETGPTY